MLTDSRVSGEIAGCVAAQSRFCTGEIIGVKYLINRSRDPRALLVRQVGGSGDGHAGLFAVES